MKVFAALVAILAALAPPAAGFAAETYPNRVIKLIAAIVRASGAKGD